jgi:hypothetical protein
MLWLLLGGLALFAFMGGLRAFERASIATLKSFLLWAAALAGLSLMLMLVLTGREGIAIGALVMFAPVLWERARTAYPWLGPARRPAPPPGGGGRASGAGTRSGDARRGGAMSRAEALEILGLRPGATAEEIRAAHHRLMRAAHPDAGGSDWIAARLNLAREVLLGPHGR